MDLSLGSAVTTLQPGQPVRLHGSCGRRLSCVQGAIWITQDGDLRDTLLSPGADFVFQRDGDVVLQALGEPALLAREEGLAPAPRPAGVIATLWARFRNARRIDSAREALSSLSDRELNDIGVRRGQIDLLGI